MEAGTEALRGSDCLATSTDKKVFLMTTSACTSRALTSVMFERVKRSGAAKAVLSHLFQGGRAMTVQVSLLVLERGRW